MTGYIMQKPLVVDPTKKTLTIDIDSQCCLDRQRSSITVRKKSTSRIGFIRLLQFNPITDHGLIAANEVQLRNQLSEKPALAKQRYQFQKAFPDHNISPLSLLCALGATVKTIQICYDADPSALTEVDAVHGTPLHYACTYQADQSVVRFLLAHVPKGHDTIFDRNKQTVLHVAAQNGSTAEILSLMVDRSPLALHMLDGEGNTPLHLAIQSSVADSVDVVKALLGRSPARLCTLKNFAGATPLHLAIYMGAPFCVIQTLVEACEASLRICDIKGRLPLHVAATVGAEMAVFVYLLRKYREAINVNDKRGRTPYLVAMKHKRPFDVVLLLKAKRMAIV